MQHKHHHPHHHAHPMPDDGSFQSLIHRIKWMHRQQIVLGCEGIGLTEGMPKIIHYVKHHDGCIQREIAEHCHIKAPTATELLNSMERAGLIRKESSPRDKRIWHIYLTERGEEAYTRVGGIFDRANESAFQGFTEEEKQEALRILSRIAENMVSDVRSKNHEMKGGDGLDQAD